MKNNLITSLVIVICLSITLVSAFEFDNAKLPYDSLKQEVTIVDSFGFGAELMKVRLIENTYQCSVDCYAILEITNYNKLYLSDKYDSTFNWEFENLATARVETINHNFKIAYSKSNITEKIGEDCTYDEKNASTCKDSTITKEVYNWEDFKFENNNLPIGTYWLKLEGEKDWNEEFDWRPTLIGVTISEWAKWGVVVSVGNFTFDNPADLGDDTAGTIGDITSFTDWRSITTGCRDSNCLQTFANTTGTNAYNTHINTGGFSLWFSPTANTSLLGAVTPCFFQRDAGGNNDGDFNLGLVGSGGTQCNAHTPGHAVGTAGFSLNNPVAEIVSTSTFTAGQWYHLYFKKNDSNFAIYVNGVREAIGSAASTQGFFGVTSTTAVFTGGIAGQIDEFKIYNVELTDTQIANIYATEHILVPFTENNQSYTSNAYEQTNSTYSLNFTTEMTYTGMNSYLWYNGTRYVGILTGDGKNNITSKTLSLNSTGTKNLFWEVVITNATASYSYNSTTKQQNVSNINFSRCDGSLFNISYLNITYKDEVSNGGLAARVDASSLSYWITSAVNNRTLSYSNTTADNSTAFCFRPQSETINYALTNFQYSRTGYPQRKYTNSGTLTNVTTNITLYLLSSTDGLYSTYQVMDTSTNILSGVTIQIERQFSGVWTKIEEGITDSAGSSTFWLNPDYDHRITFTKTGYTTQIVTIRPSSSTYTVQMAGTSTSGVTYNNTLEGLLWRTGPEAGWLDYSQIYTFFFNLTANKSNIVACKIEVSNYTGTILNTSTGCSASGGYVSVTYNTSGIYGGKVYSAYYVNTTTSGNWLVVDSDDAWYLYDLNNSVYREDSNLWRFFHDIGNSTAGEYNIFGDTEAAGGHNRSEFSRLMLYFLLLAVGLAMLSYTGLDFNSPGILAILIGIVTAFVSFTGILEVQVVQATNPYSAFLNKWFVALITILGAAGYGLMVWANNKEGGN